MSDWSEWNGGECPVPNDTEVIIAVRYGTGSTTPCRAGDYRWNHKGYPGDIIAYKVVSEAAPTTEQEPKTATETQVGGDHYKSLKIQPMEYSMANNLNACQHTAIKYITRYKNKGGKQDIEKAIHTLELLLEMEYPE